MLADEVLARAAGDVGRHPRRVAEARVEHVGHVQQLAAEEDAQPRRRGDGLAGHPDEERRGGPRGDEQVGALVTTPARPGDEPARAAGDDRRPLLEGLAERPVESQAREPRRVERVEARLALGALGDPVEPVALGAEACLLRPPGHGEEHGPLDETRLPLGLEARRRHASSGAPAGPQAIGVASGAVERRLRKDGPTATPARPHSAVTTPTSRPPSTP